MSPVRVLFVDDEENLLTALTRRLRREPGLTVLTAPSARAAIILLEQERIDVVVSDLLMPQMGGIELLAIVAERYPRIRRIILSGSTTGVAVPQAQAILDKPCSLQHLVSAIRNEPLSAPDNR